ncbi:unnamed protein product [Merluccius merluccius]
MKLFPHQASEDFSELLVVLDGPVVHEDPEGSVLTWGAIMAIIEYPDVMAARQLAVLNLPIPDLVKYSILGVSVALLLLAVAILLWQIFRCCTRTDATQDTDHERRSLSTMELEEPSEEKVIVGIVSGSLRFTLFYEPLPSRLVVTILQAEGLQRRSQAHRPHPFIRLRLMWQENQEAKRLKKGEGVPHALCTVLQEWHTRMVRDSCSPMFGEQFSCDLLRQEDLPGIIVRMEVKDFDEFSRHMILGEVRVPLRHMNMCYPLELQEHLQTPQKDPVGEVLLSLKFLPTAQRLEVGLLKIRTLQTATNADTALYARIIVQCNQCKLRHQKTTAVRQCQVTVFNQVLMFSLPEFPPQECNVAISVYETDATRKHKHLVGQLTVGKDKRSEDHHWTLMMRSFNEDINVIVVVVDMNDEPPTFSSSQYNLNVKEDTEVAGGTDSFSSTTTIMVSITDADNRPPWFQPCSKIPVGQNTFCESSGYTGSVSLTVHEATQTINSFQFSRTTVTIQVVPMSLHPPVFERERYSGFVSGLGSMVVDLSDKETPLMIRATDADYIGKGKAAWGKLFEASVFRSALGRGPGGLKDGIQYTNEAFKNDEDSDSTGPASPTELSRKMSEQPAAIVATKAVTEEAISKYQATLLATLPEVEPSPAEADKEDKEVKPILTKERRTEEGYKSVWFKEDIVPDAKEDVHIIPDNGQQDAEEDEEGSSSSGNEEDIKPRQKVLFGDTDVDSGLGIKASDSEYNDRVTSHL